MRSVFVVLLLCSGLAVTAQDSAARKAVSIAFENSPPKKLWKHAASKPRTEIQLVFSGLFLFYKHFISSQDGSRCNFHPTCSEYSLLCIKKHGLVVGTLATFDRLIRCNPASPELYETDTSGRNIDLP